MGKHIYWFEEIGKEHRDLVGNKCANLGEMAKIGLPVPPGFALSVEAYEYFLKETNAIEDIKKYLQKFSGGPKTIKEFNEASKEIRLIVEAKKIPQTIGKEIMSYYKDLCRKCGAEKVAVSVRSAGPKSHPGQYETYLNVNGESDLLEKVKKVWASTFNPRSIAFRAQKGLPLESDPIGVAVLKMVNARASGVMFTAEPNTGDHTKMIIEGNWGLGESVVGGDVVPDIFFVDKASGKAIERTLGKKARYVASNQVGANFAYTPEEKSSTFCVNDDELKEIVKLGQKLEDYFGVPQDVEWAVDQDLNFPDNITLLQTRREIMAVKKSPVDQTLDFIMRR
ncbi:MAG: PEP/pyruvate-binding domain-containing protein [Desulfotomaculaceae bacterium]|nr:PEP/pyruvate-binding domain-containing protein [Desulfotomaculaceae bacterium]